MSHTTLPLVLKHIDTGTFFEISPNRFVLTSSIENKYSVEECPNCTYFESSNHNLYKVSLCDKCSVEISRTSKIKNAFK